MNKQIEGFIYADTDSVRTDKQALELPLRKKIITSLFIGCPSVNSFEEAEALLAEYEKEFSKKILNSIYGKKVHEDGDKE